MDRVLVLVAILAAALPARAASADVQPAASPYAAWKNGPSPDPAYFPIGVWLQNPAHAARYKRAGVNLYVGLWRGPTDEQLKQLQAAGMRVFCAQNATALAHRDDPTIAGWLLPDEPDNAQPVRDPNTGRQRYGPPVKPEDVVRRYEKARDADPSRPVLLNLGQGVANDNWRGRGPGAKPEDYLGYVRGGDIVSFDVYPVAGVPPHHDLWLVGKGVQRLVTWTGGTKPVWNCLECTHIDDPDHKATAKQVRSEAWLALVHGSSGIIWFVHEFKPRSNDHALLDDPEMLAAVTAINRQIHELAPVLNSANVSPGTTVTSSAADAPIAATTKGHGGATYIFAVAARGKAVKGSFEVPGVRQDATAEVIGERRKIELKGGRFEDEFDPYGVHLYRIQ